MAIQWKKRIAQLIGLSLLLDLLAAGAFGLLLLSK
jgi:hypothetical protein